MSGGQQDTGNVASPGVGTPPPIPRTQEQMTDDGLPALGKGSQTGSQTGDDPRSEEQKKRDAELAERLSGIIEDANSRVLPLCRMIRKHIENMESRKEEDRDERELVEQVKPLLTQAEKILNETQGAVKGADPDNRLSRKAQNHAQTHTATPEEQRLAAALKVMVDEVGGTIEWAKNKLDAFPKAKKDLGPLLDALGAPLTQIVSGVCLLLAGVLNLVGSILSGLGLDSLLKGIYSALGLEKIYKGLGLNKVLGSY
ncbi:lea domain protein [Moniliophthora roreri MCA 2997]|uniref:Lea domain protein n=2 Tax=Moniliophthora roreri TaxID=221103 RepID=V2XQV1_MONRO|nr:lea domain protein [Moniliophthora roreri MCA 2997]KAI3619636.1 lea domain protein [Moniliophthora roreri]